MKVLSRSIKKRNAEAYLTLEQSGKKKIKSVQGRTYTREVKCEDGKYSLNKEHFMYWLHRKQIVVNIKMIKTNGLA